MFKFYTQSRIYKKSSSEGKDGHSVSLQWKILNPFTYQFEERVLSCYFYSTRSHVHLL